MQTFSNVMNISLSGSSIHVWLLHANVMCDNSVNLREHTLDFTHSRAVYDMICDFEFPNSLTVHIQINKE